MGTRFGGRVVGWTANAVRLALCAVSITAPLGAQAIVKGVLYNDSTGAAMRGTVMLIDPATDAPVMNMVTDSLGYFSLRVTTGIYQIAAVRAGFTQTLSAPIPLQNGESMTVRVPMAVLGTETKHRIGVTEHIRPTAQSGDVDPSRFGSGSSGSRHSGNAAPGLHFGRGELDRSGVNTLGEFLQRLPGLNVMDPGSAATVQMSRNPLQMAGVPQAPGAACHVGWFVDGHRMDYGGSIDPSTDALGRMSLAEVDAVEVFRGLSEMPAEFASPELTCGAVAVWTRRS